MMVVATTIVLIEGEKKGVWRLHSVSLNPILYISIFSTVLRT